MAKETKKPDIRDIETADFATDETGSPRVSPADLLDAPEAGIHFAPIGVEYLPGYLAALKSDAIGTRTAALSRLSALREAAVDHVDAIFELRDDEDFHVRTECASALFHITGAAEYLTWSVYRECLLADPRSITNVMSWIYHVPEARWTFPLLKRLTASNDSKVSRLALIHLAFLFPESAFVQSECLRLKDSEAANHIVRYYRALRLHGPPCFTQQDEAKVFPRLWGGFWRQQQLSSGRYPLLSDQHTSHLTAAEFCRVLEDVDELPADVLPTLHSIIALDWTGESAEPSDDKKLYAIPAALARFGSAALDALPALVRFARTTHDHWARAYAWRAIDRISPEFPNRFVHDPQTSEYVPEILDAWVRSGILTELEQDETKAPKEPERPLTSEGILASIKTVQQPIVDQLNEWLSSFEGKTYSPEEASGVVAEIRHVVASAGCELVFDGQSAGIYTSKPTRAVSAIFTVKTLNFRPLKTLYSKTAFPSLAAQPLSTEE